MGRKDGRKEGRKERRKEGNALTNLQPHSNSTLIRPGKIISKPNDDAWERRIEAAAGDEAAGVGYAGEIWAVGGGDGEDEADGGGSEAANDEYATLLVLVGEVGHDDGEHAGGGVGGDSEELGNASCVTLEGGTSVSFANAMFVGFTASCVRVIVKGGEPDF